MPSIVLFGATGYTGRLTAEALVARGVKPILSARSEGKLRALADELGGGLETRVADVAHPDSVRGLVSRGDVLVTTVGPFARWGGPALDAAIGTGATYIDSTGESGFIREVFERRGAGAQAAGCALLTAMGYDWVPGNLAGALALAEAGDRATRLDIGYFILGAADMSGGTRASAAGAVLTPNFAFRGGRIVTERAARSLRTFEVRGRKRPAVSIGSSEALSLPRVHPALRELTTYLGWFGPMSRPMQAMSLWGAGMRRVPGAPALAENVMGRLVKGSTGGPDAEARSGSGSHIAAEAFDAAGERLSSVTLTGVNGYDFTARFMAWAAERAAAGEVQGTGARGPVEAFGLASLEAGVAEAGLSR